MAVDRCPTCGTPAAIAGAVTASLAAADQVSHVAKESIENAQAMGLITKAQAKELSRRFDEAGIATTQIATSTLGKVRTTATQIIKIAGQVGRLLIRAPKEVKAIAKTVRYTAIDAKQIHAEQRRHQGAVQE